MNIPLYNWFFSYRNFSKVSENLTRSGQVTPRLLQTLSSEYNTRTVVCLRRDFLWLKREKEICRKFNLDFIQYPLSPKTPTREQLLDLIGIMKSAEPPVHVHCMGGADRTGLFCFVYQLVINKTSPEEAKAQYSWTYAPIWFNYRKIMKRYGREGEEIGFEDWVTNGYER